MDIRPVTRDEFDDYRQLFARSFFMTQERADSFAYLEKDMDLSRTRVLFHNKRMMSLVQIIPFQVWFNDIKIPMGGLATLLTSPENRRQGYTRKMLEYSLKDMKENGFAISVLYARLLDLYRRFGWEVASKFEYYSFHPDHLAEMPDIKGEIIPFDEKQIELVNAVYDKFAKTKTCMVMRDEKHWIKRVLGKYSYLWKNSKHEIEGYITYDLTPTEGGWKADVRELITLTHEARCGIFAFLKKLLPQIVKITFKVPIDDLSFSYFSNFSNPAPGVETKIGPGFMLRIIDLKKAFESKRYSPELKGHVVFRIEDQLAPWNDGTFNLMVENGEASLNKTSKLCQFSCDIRTISQIYCGYFDLIQAAQIGQLTIKDNTNLLKINNYFRESTPYMSDRF